MAMVYPAQVKLWQVYDGYPMLFGGLYALCTVHAPTNVSRSRPCSQHSDEVTVPSSDAPIERSTKLAWSMNKQQKTTGR